MNRGLALLCSCALFGGAFFLPAPSEAGIGMVHRAFRGKVVITKKRPPTRFRSQGMFVRWLRGNRKQHIWPDKENKKQWTFEFMAFFNRPLNDIEVKIKFYDVTDIKKFVAADSFYIRQRGETIFSSNMILEKPRFNVDRKYRMEVLSPRNQLLSSSEFWLRGQKERYSGKVTFTDEEARLR